MSIRVGVSIAGWPFATDDPEELYRYAERCDVLDIDSLWFSERLAGPTPFLEPLAAIAMMAARTRQLKFGMSVLVLPGRNPVVVARQVATIDFLAKGRMLPAFGLGADDPREQQATGVPKNERAGRTDEAVALMRRLWTEDHVTHHGKYFSITDVTVRPQPKLAQRAVWFGGRTEAAYRRVARYGDGWLAASVTPDEARAAIPTIQRLAADYGRRLDDDHFGVILPYCITSEPEAALARVGVGLSRARPDVDVREYAAIGTAQDCAALLERFVDAGISKFVLRATCPPEQIHPQLELLAEHIMQRVEAYA